MHPVILIIPWVAIGLPLILGSAVAVGFCVFAVGAIGFGVYALAKSTAQATPVLRDFVPPQRSEQELERLEAERQARAKAEQAVIEAEIRDALEDARREHLPKTPAEAQQRLLEAHAVVAAKEEEVRASEAAARELSGGWSQVCEAREALAQAEEEVRQLQSDCAMLLPQRETAMPEGATTTSLCPGSPEIQPWTSGAGAKSARGFSTYTFPQVRQFSKPLPICLSSSQHPKLQTSAFRRTAMIRPVLAAIRRI